MPLLRPCWAGVIAFSLPAAASGSACGDGGHLDHARLPRGFCSHLVHDFASAQPRGITQGASSSVLLVEREKSRVVSVSLDGDASPSVVASGASGLNHGIAVHGGYVYASSATTVFRWKMDSTDASARTTPQVVMDGMNADGQGGAPQGHKTRTVVFDSEGGCT